MDSDVIQGVPVQEMVPTNQYPTTGQMYNVNKMGDDVVINA